MSRMRRCSTRRVGDETTFITPEIYGNASQTKFIPILLERDDNGNELRFYGNTSNTPQFMIWSAKNIFYVKVYFLILEKAPNISDYVRNINIASLA